MSNSYGRIAFTDDVQDVQRRYGSRDFYRRHAKRGEGGASGDALTADVREYLQARDSFYLATTSKTGWPYVQFRGGAPGFLRVIDVHTVGWADFRGNLQYISTGNLAADDRVAMIVMDYPNRERLKIFGHARVAFTEDEPELVAGLATPGYEATIERAVLVSVEAFDWNCHQHITPRFTLDEIEPRIAVLRHRITALEADNAVMRGLLSDKG